MNKRLVFLMFVVAVLSAEPAHAAFNSALSQAEADEIMNRHCALQRGYARDAAPALDMPWEGVTRRAYEVLRNNVDIVEIQSMLRRAEASGASGNSAQRAMAEFQICLLDNKIAYAEAHERQSARQR